MPHWLRFSYGDEIGFGVLRDETIVVHRGDMFDNPEPTTRTVPLREARLLTPTVPSKLIALWNNFHALAAKLGAEPEDPLYLLKANSSVALPGAAVRRPRSYAGKIVYEGELGVVIGKTCTEVSENEAEHFIFGYTCVNDITAADLINKDPTFAQWVRAKSFDGFGPFGPVVATNLEPEKLIVRTILNGNERQNYPIADMIFSPRQLVSRISHDMTLFPGDVICCGTSLGVGTMKEPHNTVAVAIDGIGVLTNVFDQ